MKNCAIMLLVLAATVFAVSARPMRVAVVGFENRAGDSLDLSLTGNIGPQVVSDKGVYVLESALANEDAFKVIDRNDLAVRIEPVLARSGEGQFVTPVSFLKAAQALNADVVLRGALLSFSPCRQTVNQGGYETEFVVLSLRVALQALDTLDGTVIASAEGASSLKIRQTDSQKTVIGEDEIVGLLRAAVAEAVPNLTGLLQKRFAAEEDRPIIKLSVKTDVDPALVELDGMLIGTTPLVEFKAYKGDHVLTIGKAGFRDISKRIVFEEDTSIEVTMLRIELTADELKKVMESMRMNVVLGVPEPALIINTFQTE